MGNHIDKMAKCCSGDTGGRQKLHGKMEALASKIIDMPNHLRLGVNGCQP